MTPLVSQLWPQFMADPAFASCFGQVIVEHARMLRQSQQVIFTLRSAAPLDKGLCARLLASLQPDYEGFELKIENHFGYATLDETALRDLLAQAQEEGLTELVVQFSSTDSSAADIERLIREVERSAGGADWLVRFYPNRDSVGLVEILLVH